MSTELKTCLIRQSCVYPLYFDKNQFDCTKNLTKQNGLSTLICYPIYSVFIMNQQIQCAPENLTHHLSDFAIVTGQEFLNNAVRVIAEISRADSVHIGALRFSDRQHIWVQAQYGTGASGTDFKYDPGDRACIDVIKSGKVKIVHNNMQALYPNDNEAKTHNLCSYIGIPLFDNETNPIGLIVARRKRPFKSECADAVIKSLATLSNRIAEEVKNAQMKSLLSAFIREPLLPAENIFRSLCSTIADAFLVRAAFVAECLPEDTDHFGLVAFSIDGKPVIEVEGNKVPYKIAPCQHLKSREPYLVEENLQKQFPDEQDFIDLGLQAYLGTLLHNREGEVIGHIALLHDKSLSGKHLDLELLNLLADRVSRELEHHQSEKKRLENYYQHKEVEDTLRAEQERALITLQSIGDAVVSTDASGRIEYMNPIAADITGWTSAEAVGRPLREVVNIVHGDNREPIPDPIAACLMSGQIGSIPEQSTLINRQKREYAIEDSAAPIREHNNNIVGAVLVFRDVTEQRRLQLEVTYQAKHDALTGLLNRYEFERRLTRVIDSASKDQKEHVLMFMDLDRFKIVNDSCGHAIGDELLRQLTKLFNSKIRQHDSLARLGGDEFAVLLEHCSMTDASRIANQLRSATEKYRFNWQNKQFQVGVSIGLVPIDYLSLNTASILLSADQACYTAKDLGGNRVHIFQENDEEIAKRVGDMNSINNLQNALNEDRFLLYAQPIVPLNPEGQPRLRFEILLRMLSPQGDVLLPSSFVSAAERYHLATSVDRWVVKHAFSKLSEYREQLGKLEMCTINLSGQSIGDIEFRKFLLRQIDLINLPPEKLYFEITETAAMANVIHATELMEALRERGCCFCLDDFGTGLSSFGYLKNLPVDVVKIDGLFVRDMLVNSVDFALVRSINEVAQLLGKQTVAEHVENERLFQKLAEIGVDCAQGYGVGRPEPLSSLLDREL